MTALNNFWPWISLAFLGAFHGLNPGMGWLFAVALGLQERRLGRWSWPWDQLPSVTRWRSGLLL